MSIDQELDNLDLKVAAEAWDALSEDDRVLLLGLPKTKRRSAREQIGRWDYIDDPEYTRLMGLGLVNDGLYTYTTFSTHDGQGRYGSATEEGYTPTRLGQIVTTYGNAKNLMDKIAELRNTK